MKKIIIIIFFILYQIASAQTIKIEPIREEIEVSRNSISTVYCAEIEGMSTAKDRILGSTKKNNFDIWYLSWNKSDHGDGIILLSSLSFDKDLIKFKKALHAGNFLSIIKHFAHLKQVRMLRQTLNK